MLQPPSTPTAPEPVDNGHNKKLKESEPMVKAGASFVQSRYNGGRDDTHSEAASWVSLRTESMVPVLASMSWLWLKFELSDG